MQIGIGVTAICIVLCVALHLAALRILWRLSPKNPKTIRESHIALLVLGCIVAHLLEIAVFTFGLFIVAAIDGDTKIAMEAWTGSQLDLWFYSASFYTSLGADQTPPSIGLRLFTACEALAGLILITWTASFLFLIMQQTWVTRDGTSQ